MMPDRKLGRLARTFDPRMPHASAVRMMAGLLPLIPSAQHWAQGMSPDFGMMLNDELGNCTMAGAYHAMQVWSYHGRNLVLTEPDSKVLRAYEEFCGYRPNPDGSYNQATDNGGVEQDIIRRWLSNGMPIVEGSSNGLPGRSKIVAGLEVDVHQLANVQRAIYDCGVAYIGFNVPHWLMAEDPMPLVWHANVSADNTVVGGHCVVLTGYDAEARLFDLISWGIHYQMDFDFFSAFVDEAYALVHPWWINGTGKTPFGLSEADLVSQMRYFT